jgi:nitrite reductase/ring-hydroxylating ferredoxin subunit
VLAGTADELAREGRLVVYLSVLDVSLVVVRTRRGLFAFDDMCPHVGGSLRGGKVAGAAVTCPWHGRRYSLASGRCVSARRAGARLRRWQAWIDGGQVWIGEEKR